MRMSVHAVLATILVFVPAVAHPAADPLESTSIGRFAMEAFVLPVREKVDLCSGKHPALQAELAAASTELRRRYVAQLALMLGTEKFSSLLAAEVPEDLFLLIRQQSAMRRNVNTTISRERCESTLGEFSQMSDQLLQFTIDQLLTPTMSIINRNASRNSR